jgi:arabinoxylan arabinofuranohydrolase
MVTTISNGDYIKVKGVNFGTAGANSFIARIAGSSTGNIELHLDSQTGTLVGTCAVSSTGGTQTWATKSCTVSGATGTHDLFLKFTGGSGDLFNFNWWMFSSPVRTIDNNSKKSTGPIALSTMNNSIHVSFADRFVNQHVIVSLIDISGRVVSTLFTGTLLQNAVTIPIGNNSARSGAYVVNITANNEQIINKQFVVKN